jgi:hypothetical protein
MIAQMLRTSNPQQVMQQLQMMAGQNPQIKQALDQFRIASYQMQQSGMGMKQYAIQYARQYNVDLQQLMATLGCKQ